MILTFAEFRSFGILVFRYYSFRDSGPFDILVFGFCVSGQWPFEAFGVRDFGFRDSSPFGILALGF